LLSPTSLGAGGKAAGMSVWGVGERKDVAKFHRQYSPFRKAKLANHFHYVRVDAFVVIPNHVHGKIVNESPEPSHRSYIGATRLLMAESMDDQDAVDKGLRDSRDGSPQPRKRPNGPKMNSLGQ
jgi:hypothetical protein